MDAGKTERGAGRGPAAGLRFVTAVASLPLVAATILRKAAADEGFDIELGEETGWLRFESTQTPATVALTAGKTGWVLRISPHAIAKELATECTPWIGAQPASTDMAFAAPDAPSLYHLLSRARMLGRSLPTVPLAQFTREVAGLPRTTETERLTVERVGQDIFRLALMDYWDGRCPLTGIDEPRLLRASHIKPWADCETDAERLDVHNGLLLAAHFDAAFDAGLFTFDPGGRMIVSSVLSRENAERLGLADAPPLKLSELHAPFLDWHRRKVFVRP